ncbi:MAG: hypothetical protein JWM59_18 [Verrucomicrobiales bacterium]|nr:hypothetical protein [Verrucomicrobiales bacterium]
MVWDYLKARHHDRMMRVEVHDAVILSGRVMPPADSSPDGDGTAELVRLYGRNAGK